MEQRSGGLVGNGMYINKFWVDSPALATVLYRDPY